MVDEGVDGKELAGGGVVAAGAEVDEAGGGVGPVAGVADLGVACSRVGDAVTEGVVLAGRRDGTAGVGDQPDASDIVAVQVFDGVAGVVDLGDRGG